jgi:hypothetical protein
MVLGLDARHLDLGMEPGRGADAHPPAALALADPTPNDQRETFDGCLPLPAVLALRQAGRVPALASATALPRLRKRATGHRRHRAIALHTIAPNEHRPMRYPQLAAFQKGTAPLRTTRQGRRL